jgi:uncharacterized protein YndB with AHSA1/START domain
MTNETTRGTKPVVTFERKYEGVVEDLWYLWTTREGFESWWGPEGFRVEVRKLDLRVGGELAYDMIAADPEQIEFMKKANMPLSHGVGGRFVEIVPLQRLGISQMIDFIPGMRPYENKMLAEFFPEGQSVRMVITVDEHQAAEWTRRATQGMDSQLTKVPAALEARVRSRSRP